MYKQIMLAVDGSDSSNAAIEETIKLIKGQQTHLRIIHVLDESFLYTGGPGFDYASLNSVLREQGEELLTKAEQRIKSQCTVEIEKSLLELKPLQGRIAEVIAEEAKECAADLLILGTHGRRGFSRFFIGSVAENTVRISHLPVLLVRE